MKHDITQQQGQRPVSAAQVERLTAAFQRATSAEAPVSVCGPLALQLAEAMNHRGHATNDRGMLAHARALHSRWTAIVEGKAPWPHVAPERPTEEEWWAASPQRRPPVASRLVFRRAPTSPQ